MSSPTIPAPNQLLFYQFSSTYQCNTQQIVVRTVISAGEFHVLGKTLHLTITEMGSECKAPQRWKWFIQTMSFRPNLFHKNVL